MPNKIKKWSMLQIWRMQQIAQLASLVLLAMNLSVLIWERVKWRDPFLGNSITGIGFIMLMLVAFIWGVAIIWDLRLKMWREQQTVVVEKNPYTKEKMTAKEIVIYEKLWLPILERLGKDDPKFLESARALKIWLDKELERDHVLAHDVDELYGHIEMK